MARTLAEFKAQMESKKAAATAAPAPTTEPKAPAAAPAATAPKQAAPPAPPVTRTAEPVKIKREEIAPKVEPIEPPKVEAPAAPKLVIPPDIMRPVDYKVFFDRTPGTVEGGVRAAAQAFGVSPDEFRRVAAAQGVDLDAIAAARKKGRTYDEVATAARERGVIGFLSPEEREAQFRRVYDDVEKAVRGEAPDALELKRAKADKGLLGGYLAAGTQAELPDVAKPGEHGYTVAALLVDALKDDAEASKVYDLYGRSLATGNTQKYIEKRTEDLKRRAGISASQPDAVERVAKLRRQAINEVIAYKTVGQWTPAVTLGDIAVTEGREAPSFFGALKPNVEIIGFNNKRQAIFRQESPMGVLFRVIDIPQAAVSGVLMGQGATTGIQTGANLFEAAMEATEGASPYVRFPAMQLGMAASVVAPDMLLVGGKASKVARVAIDTARIRKIAPQVTDLLSTIAKSRAAQDFEAARKAEIELRSLTPAVADQLDRYDAAAAEMMKLVDPATDTAREDLTAIIGARIKAAEQEAAGRVWLHPSQRRDVLEAKGKTKDTPYADYDELFSTDKLLDRVAAARVAHERDFPKTMAAYIANYAEGTARDVLAPLAKATGLSAENIDRLAGIVRIVAPTALMSEAKFRDQLQAALKADDTFKQDAFKNVRKALHVPGKGNLPNRLARKIKDIGSQSIDDLRQADLALLDRATDAIQKNNEARAYAAAALMDEIATKGKLRVQPVSLFDDVAVLDKAGKPVRLSAAGQVFLKQIRRALPAQDFEEAYRLAALNDQIILTQAKRNGVDPFTLYKQKFPQIMRATAADLERFGISPKVAPPTSTPPVSPHGKKALRWSPKLGAPKFDVDTVESAKRYLLDARAGRYGSDAFATFARTDGTTGAYVITVGDVRIVADSPLDGDDFNLIVKVGSETVEKPSVAANPLQALLFGVQEAEPLMEARVQRGAAAIEGVPEKLALRAYRAPATVAEDLGEVTEAMETPIVGELDDLINEADRIMRRYDEVAGTALRDRVRASVYAEAERVLEGRATLEGLRERVGRLAENLANMRGQKVRPPSFGALPAGARRLPPTTPEAARIREVLAADPYASMDDLRDAFPMIDPTSLAKLRGEAQAPIIQRVKALSVDEMERSLDIAEDALDGVENALRTGRMTADDAARVRRQINGYVEFIERELETRTVVPSREVTAPVAAREVTETGMRPEREVTESLGRVEAARIARLQSELEQAVQSGDKFRQGELEMEIENLRRIAQPEAVPAPAAVEEVVEAPRVATPAETAARNLITKGEVSDLDAPLVVTHRTGSETLDLSQLDPLAERASRQSKRGRAPKVGLYTYGPEVTDAEASQYGARKIDIELPPGTKVLDVTALEGGTSARISRAEAEALLAEGVQVIRGKDVIGPTEYVILDRRLLERPAPTTAVPPTPAPISAAVEAQPEAVTSWEGVRVIDPFRKNAPGVVVKWEPLSTSMTDALVRYDDGTEMWVASNALRPEGGTVLPTRAQAIRAADEKALADLKAAREKLIAEFGEKWQGAEFGKAQVGTSLNQAIAEVEARLARAGTTEPPTPTPAVEAPPTPGKPRAAKRKAAEPLTPAVVEEATTSTPQVEAALISTETTPSRIQMAAKQTNVRNPELVAMAKAVREGKATREQYEALVNRLRPITPYKQLPAPTPEAQMLSALKSNQKKKIGAPRQIVEGTPVGLRVDIPALQDHGAWVVTVHEKRKSKSPRSLAGSVIGYDNVATIRNAEFVVPGENSILIASGVDNKMPYATIEGAWVPMTTEQAVARAQAAFNDPAWVQVGQDPLRHAYFYDRATTQPIVAAEEVIQIGPLVLAKNPTYAPKEKFLYSKSALGEGHRTSSGISYSKLMVEGVEDGVWYVTFADRDGMDRGFRKVRDADLTREFGEDTALTLRQELRRNPNRMFIVEPYETDMVRALREHAGDDLDNLEVEPANALSDAARVASDFGNEDIAEIALQLREKDLSGFTVSLNYTMDDANGAYWPTFNAVELSRRSTPQTVVHEIVHAMTMVRLATPDRLSAKGKQAVARINEVYRRVLNTPSIDQNFYGLTDINEFVAEAFSNVEFQRALNDIQVGQTTLWGRFVEAVAELLGLKPGSALSEVMAATETLMDEDVVMGGFRSPAPREGASLKTVLTAGQRPVAATLFSGGGLVEAGLQYVVRPGYAVEARGDIAAHYGKVFGEHVENADVRTVDFGKLKGKNIGYLHASPVCKNFSAAKAVNAAGEQALDIETAAATARALDELKPPVFTVENVADYADSDAMKLIEDALTRNGYTFDKNVYNAADYGAATTRKRLILRAVRRGELPPLPAKTGPSDWYARVSDLVNDLPKSNVPSWMAERLAAARIDWQNVDRPLMVAGGSAGKNVPYAYAGGPTFTIKATPKELHRIILPGGDVREATPRVLARITGLPDVYPLPKTKDAAVTIIGNGIPLEMTDSVIGPLIASRVQPLLSPRAPATAAEAAEEVTEVMPPPSVFFKTVSPTGAVTGVTEFMDDGRSIIYLLEGADATTVLNGMARVLRRNVVNVEEMDGIVAWLKTRGVTVGHQFGEFTGDAGEVQKAEDLFAKAFEQYVLEGNAPTSTLFNVFDALKTTVANIYKVANDPVIGVPLQPQVRQVFNRVFEGTPDVTSASLKDVLRRELSGEVPDEASILDILSSEAVRRGLPQAQVADLQKRFDDVVNALHAKGQRVTEDTVVLTFPVKVMGKEQWTVGDLADAQVVREQKAKALRASEIGVDLDLMGRGRGRAGRVREETPVEFIRQALAPVDKEPALRAQVRSGLRMLAASFIGGDVALEKNVRELTPELRRAFDTGERVIEEHIGGTITMLNDAIIRGNNRELLRYLSGAVDVRKTDGRPVISAGHDSMGAVLDMYRRSFSSMDPELRKALVQLADAVNSPNRGQAVTNLGFNPKDGEPFAAATAEMKATRETATKALDKILGLAKGTEDEVIGPALSSALRTALDWPGSYRPSHEMRLAEVVTYLSGLTARPTAKGPRLFTGTSEEAAGLLLKEVAAIYGDEEVARRVAVLVGAFGSAQLGKDALMRMGLGINAKTRDALVNWSVGKQPGAENVNALQFTVSRYGANLDFVRDAVLDVDMYIPRMARDRMAKALARAKYRPSGTTTAEDGFNVLYRYMKTRMTRGSFFIKQRYYMMNTVDHFTQMSLQAGFGAGLLSLSRVLAQDVLILPGFVQLIEAARRLPGGSRIPANQVERFRAGLTQLGDKAARQLGERLSLAKYHIEVNPVLEGLDGGFRAGGKVYTYKAIRNIAVEEGVFASMATRELQSAIQREGTMFANAAADTITSSSGKGAFWNFMADWQKTVEDTAEAWSERERLGAMITLMEMGYDPRAAARVTVDALYDYSQSMTKMDRHMLVGILFPFWAFQKNANMQVVNLIFSPWGAYRMMCIRRARERSADMLAEVLYNDVGGEYGIDVKSMPPELQDSYYAVVKAFEDSYNGDPPPEAKRALRMLMQGRALTVEDGKLVELSSELQRLRSAGGFADLQQFAGYTVMRPSKAERGSYMRDRTGFAVPFPRTEAVRMYYAMAGDDHTYMEVFYPESVIEAGLKHITQIAAAQVLAGAYLADQLPGVDFTEGGLREVSPFGVVAPVADITRSPIIAPLLAGTMEDITAPKKVSKAFAAGTESLVAVHPLIGRQLDEAFGTTFLRVPAIMDPMVKDPSQMSDEDISRIRALQAEYPDASTVRDQRYYIPAGVWAAAFENSPVGELNQMLLRYEENPLERTDIRGAMLSWARGAAGVDVEMTSATKSAKYEEPTKLKETTGI